MNIFFAHVFWRIMSSIVQTMTVQLSVVPAPLVAFFSRLLPRHLF